MTEIDTVFSHFNSKKELASRLGVKPQSLTRWSRFGVPPGAAIELERITEGRIKAVDIPLYSIIPLHQR